MGLSISNFVGGAVITASDILDKQDEVERYINGGIEAADLKTSASWVDSKHLVKPEFYGSPAPRTQSTTFDAHYRRTTNSITEAALFFEDISTENYLVIPGLAVSFHLPEEAYCQIYTNFYVFGAQDGGHPSNMESSRACKFALHVDGAIKESTIRSHYAATAAAKNAAKKQHSIAFAVDGTLARGNHSISVRILMSKNSGTSTRDWERIYVGARNLVVHLNYK